jgi:hypothetical protein
MLSQMIRASAAAILAAGALTIAPAVAQTYPDQDQGQVPMYRTWQPEWSHGEYDHRHVMLGTVSDFSAYRLTVTRENGDTQTVDLKNGTVIEPDGATPQVGESVALVGYYSKGTFIANRVVLRDR